MSADSSQPARILIIDDYPGNVEILSLALQSNYDCRAALDGAEALRLLHQPADRPDLILLDVLMPGLDGYEVCRLIKQEPGCQEIPVIFVSALAEVQSKLQALAMGGVDYITKPFNFREVRTRVAVHLRRYALQRQLAEEQQVLDNKVQALIHEAVAATAAQVSEASATLDQPCLDALDPACRLRQTGWILLRSLMANEDKQWHDAGCAHDLDLSPETITEQVFAMAERIDEAYVAQSGTGGQALSKVPWPEQHLTARRVIQNQIRHFCGSRLAMACMAALPEIAHYYETVAAFWQQTEQGMNHE